MYVHGGGMDQPIGMLRMDYSYDFPDAVGIIPHASWRGTYEIASFTTPDCKQVFLPYAGMVFQDSLGRLAFPASVTNEQGIEQDTTQQRCVEIDFPGKYQGMSRLLRRQTASGPIAWMGSLVQDGQEASGLMFRRNRFYDPASGRFTQEDPIGLAGGLNAYGFAQGDPVNYGDPYGLSCTDRNGRQVACPSGERQPQRQPQDGDFNPLKFGVGAANVVRGVHALATGVRELGIAADGGPFAVLVAVPGVWHVTTGVANVNRGSRQIGESLHDRTGPSARNVLGLLPFGQKFDDPIEPGPADWMRSVARTAVINPLGAVRHSVRDFFALDK